MDGLHARNILCSDAQGCAFAFVGDHTLEDDDPVGHDGIDVVVTNGVVVLKGMIPDERERAALRVAAENVPGVKAVHDRLVWIDSVSGIVIPRP